MTCPMNDNMIKIGITAEPHQRLKSLSSTSTPEDFKIAFLWYTSDARRAEALAHDFFSDHRYNPRREFFELYPGEQPATVQKNLVSPMTNPYEIGLEYFASKIEEIMKVYGIKYQLMDNSSYQSWYEDGKKLFPEGPSGF